ncbi:hypothetical protein E8E12_000748 [Didymella heteroderae]|uniref:Cytochrome P450 n=1 Tax=Didymella heteroderae TaxID=1769908 RepID=A0A9P4WGA6_9PLEO|nr:hypothetical protein E8E12_000748 [Didymella heteroderae]
MRSRFVRIAPNEVAIADPEALKTIYSAHSGFVKTDFYLPFRASWGRYADAFTNLDERQHMERRRIVNKLYSMSNIVSLESGIDKCIEELTRKLNQCAHTEDCIDLASWVQWYAFDVIGQLFFSHPFGFLEHAHDHAGYIRALDLVVPLIAVACVMPAYIRPVFLLVGILVPRISKAMRALKHIEHASEACVVERQQLHNNIVADKHAPTDMLESFFAIVRKREERADFGSTEVKMEVYGAFIAGSDTTAAAITAILYYLLRNPPAYEKLTAEIDEAVEAGLLSPVIQYHEAIGLDYLSACCKEGMRLHPSVGMTLPRHVPAGGAVISGEWFPGGTRVGVNAAVVQRSQSIFGENPDDFKPERWLGAGAAKMERYMFQFGAGSRTCIGKNISLCEMYKAIPQLLRQFQLELVKAEWETRNYWFNKPAKVHVRVRPRKCGHAL